MTNGSHKTLLGWFIVANQLILVVLIFLLDLMGKLELVERSAALAATIPSAGTYLSAVVLYFLHHTREAGSAWSKKPTSMHAVTISLLLPAFLFVGAVATLMASAYGTIDETKFGDYMMYIQTAQTMVCGLIYGNLFRKELEELQKNKP